MPERTGTSELRVCSSRGEGLPASHDVRQRLVIDNINDDMDVIWHEAPRQQAITFAIKVQQRVLDKHRDFRPSQPTRSETDIEFTIDAMDVAFSVVQRLNDSGRQAIGQTKGDELDGFRRIEVRQVASGMSALWLGHMIL